MVVVDRLDSVFELTDRRSDRFKLLLSLVNCLRGQPNVRMTIAATREFGFRHDAGLNTIRADGVRFDVPPVGVRLAPVLADPGHDPERVGAAARQLMRSPAPTRRGC